MRLHTQVKATVAALATTLVAGLLASTPASAAATPARDIEGSFGTRLVTETFALATGDAGLIRATQGPDFGEGGLVQWEGAMWFPMEKAGKIGRLDMSAHLTEIAIPEPASTPGYGPRQLSAGSPVGLWFAADGGPLEGGVGRLAPSMTTVSPYVDFGYDGVSSINATADGGAWVTFEGGEGAGLLNPDGSERHYFGDIEYYGRAEATLGPDGAALWISDGWDVIKRLTATGVQTNFPATGGDGDEIVSMTTSGSAVWYSKFNPGSFVTRSRGGVVARMSADGVPTPFPSPYKDLLPAALTPADDGGVWFTTHQGAGIGHVSPTGAYRVALMPEGQTADSVAIGPDGNIWFTDGALNRVGRVTMASFTASIASQVTPPTIPPAIPPTTPPGTGSSKAIAAKNGKVRKGTVRLRIKCVGAEECRGKIAVTKGKGKGQKVLAEGRYAVKSGKARTVKIKLKRAGRKHFAKHRKTRLKVTMTPSKGAKVSRKVRFVRT